VNGISVLTGRISMKLATNIHHVAEKVFMVTGQRLLS